MGYEWLRLHALRRWLEKSRRDGPGQPPTPNLRAWWVEQHELRLKQEERRLDEFAARLRAELDAKLARQG